MLRLLKNRLNLFFHPKAECCFKCMTTQAGKTNEENNETFYSFSSGFPGHLKSDFSEYFTIKKNFINAEEESSLLAEIEPVLKRMRYEFDHWDNAIQGFRETERLQWTESNKQILERMKEVAFSESSCMPYAHVLDLDENGHIKPHIDSIRFCGEIIAGLNLLSDAVMRLTKGECSCDVLLKRRHMYIMRGPARHEFTHEVLSKEMSWFHGEKILKKRRISLILRSEPDV